MRAETIDLLSILYGLVNRVKCQWGLGYMYFIPYQGSNPRDTCFTPCFRLASGPFRLVGARCKLGAKLAE